MKNHMWLLGNTLSDELYEYKNLGVLKNYVGSFSSNVENRDLMQMMMGGQRIAFETHNCRNATIKSYYLLLSGQI